MKAISLTQPWATLVAIGAKGVETRSWNCSYLMKPLAIHAAKGFPLWAQEFVWECLDYLRSDERYANMSGGEIIKALPRGAVICTCRVFGTRSTSMVRAGLESGNDWYKAIFTDRELRLGDYSPGRWAWILEHVEKLPEPIPAKGALSLWDWDNKPTEAS